MMTAATLRVLALTPYAWLDPGSRLRVLIHQDLLAAQGIQLSIRSFADDALFRKFQQQGLLRAGPGLAVSSLKRVRHISSVGNYDAVIVHREILPYGPPIFENYVVKHSRRLILDLDDAIFMKVPHISRLRAVLKGSGRVKALIKRAALVLAGSPYLVEALKSMGAAKVEYLPTGVVLRQARGASAWETKPQGPYCLGWIGTRDTAFYVRKLGDAIRSLASEFAVECTFIGAQKIDLPGVTVHYHDWSLEQETARLQAFHLGLYPLANTAWEQAKSGYKALQYMAAGVPVVADAVGVLTKIIRDGYNGILVRSGAEWTPAMRRIITDRTLRQSMIANGLTTVARDYSTDRIGARLAELIIRTCSAESRTNDHA